MIGSVIFLGAVILVSIAFFQIYEHILKDIFLEIIKNSPEQTFWIFSYEYIIQNIHYWIIFMVFVLVAYAIQHRQQSSD